MRAAAYLLWGLLALGPPASAGELEVKISDGSVDGSGTPIEEAAVWLEPRDAAPPARRPAQTEIRQIDKRFVPLVTIIQTGTQIDFPNEDKVKHHVYSFSAPKNFEIQLYAGRPAAPVLFDKPGIVALGCNIHDWMQGFIRVVDTPWFGKTDASGRTSLIKLPAGAYTLHVWHPFQRAETPAKTLMIVEGRRNTFEIELTLDPHLQKQRPRSDDNY